MEVELADPAIAPPPVPPPGVEVSTLGGGTEAELRALHSVVDVAFRDHYGHGETPFDAWLERTVDEGLTDRSLWWLACVGGVPAAGLLGTIGPTRGYVDTLGTLREFRGRGLGRLLMLTSFAEFHRRGQRKVTLGVDADNPTGAVELYQSLGMTPTIEGLRYELS
jgi:ribosomal protein S18 acetylase RimI-like enzyme